MANALRRRDFRGHARRAGKAIHPWPRTDGESQNSVKLEVNIVNIVYVPAAMVYREPSIFRRSFHATGASSQLSREVLARDGWRRQDCGASRDLQVHHIRSRGQLGDDAEENLIALCVGCHQTKHLHRQKQ